MVILIPCRGKKERRKADEGEEWEVWPEGAIGYDFFANFTIVVDRVGGKMSFVKN